MFYFNKFFSGYCQPRLGHPPREGESLVDRALERVLSRTQAITVESVREEIGREENSVPERREVLVTPVDLSIYDRLLNAAGVSQEVVSL